MEEKLDFSLPYKKPKCNISNAFSVLLLLILVALAAANLYIVLSRKQATPKATVRTLSAEQTKRLAAKLAQRNLYDRAAEVWQDYLSLGDLTDAERAKFAAWLRWEAACSDGIADQITKQIGSFGCHGEILSQRYRAEAGVYRLVADKLESMESVTIGCDMADGAVAS